ncbi:MAG: hypothetical protein ABFD04_01710 [Syntrophomonas sp.]
MSKEGKSSCHHGASSGVYGLAFIGALVYYFQHANTFAGYVIGFFKALLWPAFLLYYLLGYLNM